MRCTACALVFALALQVPARAQGFPDKALSKLEDYGFIQSRPRGEYHANNQQMSKLLHKAIGLGDRGSAPQVRLTLAVAIRHGVVLSTVTVSTKTVTVSIRKGLCVQAAA